MSEPVDIHCLKVLKRFGKATVLDELDLTIPAGSSLGLVGRSGAGKSTLLRILAGLDDCTSGKVAFTVPDTLVERSRPRIGMVFQNLALWPHLTARQQVECVLSSRPRRERRARAETLLSEARVPPSVWQRAPAQLSGGERQRVALARALAPDPRILLLDEPLAHVDPELRSELLSLIKVVSEVRSPTVVYVTHCRSEAQSLCQRILVLDRGTICRADGELPLG